MRHEIRVVYVPDALVETARTHGLTNLSAFVRAKLEEYVAAQADPGKGAA